MVVATFKSLPRTMRNTWRLKVTTTDCRRRHSDTEHRHMGFRHFTVILFQVFFLSLLLARATWADEKEARRLLVEVVLSEDPEHAAALEALGDEGAPIIAQMVEAWRGGQIFRVGLPESPSILLKDGEAYTNLLTGDAVIPAEEPTVDRPSRQLRKILKRIVDLIDLSSPDLNKRVEAVQKLGLSQNPEYLPDLKARIEKQKDPNTRKSFQEAVAISQLANGTLEERLKAISDLGAMKSFRARDYIERCVREGANPKPTPEMIAAAKKTLVKIDSHQKFVDFIGTLFRGLSLGSVLLLVSYGLAITFGQMGVINMAHGEFIAIGGYTTYIVQNQFAAAFGETSAAYGYYFIAAVPLAFLVSAIVGALLEKGMIQFLYKRPLESLLATWGVSMVLQQMFRLYFGAANVSVSSPEWLAGSLTVGDVSMSYSRVALIVCVAFVVIGTYLLLSKTNWGLHVRATMQNRQMASCLGVPSGRVNMITFAFGSGLAGLAGAFLSQIGNVGPSMGQTYIVDSFMVVVVGGVGNLLGAGISSLGIGMVDQGLQPILGPVMGKISVLFMIILFLQFKPRGLFPARSRSLDD
ncbi:MAG: urea transport system permease protein [Verrucomicrobiales bacterium]|jgi:urea transport system permease protein